MVVWGKGAERIGERTEEEVVGAREAEGGGHGGIADEESGEEGASSAMSAKRKRGEEGRRGGR